MFRLKVKIGRKWKLSLGVYETYLDAQIRQEELRLIGAKSIIVDKNGGELNEIMA